MEAATETKQGYEKTKVGLIPEDWGEFRLGEICPTFKSGEGITSRDISDSGSYPVYGGNGLRGYSETYTHEGDYFLIGRQGALCGNIVRVSGKNYISEHAIAVQTDSKNDILYLAYDLEYLNLNRLSESSAQPGLAVNKLLRYKVYLPPLPEQQKIAQILSTWDKAIEQNQTLIEQLKKRKKGLMQQLLTGKTRLKGFSGEWKEVKGGELFSNHSNKNHDGTSEVLSATQDKGVIPRSETGIDIKYDKASLTSYKKVEIGDYVISLRSFQGGIEYSNYEGLVSPAYTVLKEKMPISKPFYKEYMKTSNFINILNSIIYGIRDGKQISYKEFATLKLLYPPVEEQKAIAKVLTTADNEIKAQETYLAQLQAQKKGLMQQLLTGQKRVKI